jgi:hypothetical protein
MTLDLLLTPELWKSMPKTIVVVHNFGFVRVIFPANDPKEEPMIMDGDSAVVEGETNEIVKWLKPFDGVAVGCGIPQLEKFEIMHIDENL